MAMRRVANHVSQRLLRTGGGPGSVRNIFWSANTETYEARAKNLLKAEDEIIKKGSPQLIEEFRKFKNTYEYDEKISGESLADTGAGAKPTGITLAVAIAVVSYCFSLKRLIPKYEKRANPLPPTPTICRRK
ncbi:hypothetical protein MKX01_004033 [Papaver californicum]|nr:hypothetical protein MKX01_004033 [Papaver californicum]